MAHIELDNAISFLTASVRLKGKSDLMDFAPSGRGDPSGRWDVPAYKRLLDHLSTENRPGTRLMTFDQLALEVQNRSKSWRPGDPPMLTREKQQRYGILDYQTLTWPHTNYLPSPEPSTVLAFFPTDEPARAAPSGKQSEQSHWREFLLDVNGLAGVEYDELAAVFSVLGLQALRRTLISVSAQRRLYRIALPWGRFRFKRRDLSTSREYLLVPVLTLLEAGRTVQYRRTVSLTIFLLQNGQDRAPALTTSDLARLCHQSVWIHRRPALPTLVGLDGMESPFTISGPMQSFLSGHLSDSQHSLPELFDATLRKAITYLGVEFTLGEDVAKARIAISRMRSAIFGTAVHLDCAPRRSIWSQLISMSPKSVEAVVGSLLSVHAGRDGREWLIDGEGLRLMNLRVTNAFEEDTKQLALYNPISRFLLCIIPKGTNPSAGVSLNFGVSWLELLAVSVCTVKEILRSYRHEIEIRRTSIVSTFYRLEKAKAGAFNRFNRRNARRSKLDLAEQREAKSPPLDTSDDESNLAEDLNKLHVEMVSARDEADVIYGLELVGQQYASAYARILDMENIPRERDRLLRELDFAGDMLRAQETHQLSRQVAESTRNTDRLTYFVVAFALMSSITAIDVILAVIPSLNADGKNWVRVMYIVTAALFFIAWCVIEEYKHHRKKSKKTAKTSVRK